MEKNSLFYMANAYPEIGRMISYYNSGKMEAAENAKIRAINIVDTILSFPDVKPAGREEWSVVRNLIEGYDKIDNYTQKVLEKFAEPFSYKFMNQYSQAN